MNSKGSEQLLKPGESQVVKLGYGRNDGAEYVIRCAELRGDEVAVRLDDLATVSPSGPLVIKMSSYEICHHLK